MSWGISILSGLVMYNLQEIIDMGVDSPDVQHLFKTFEPRIYSWFVLGSIWMTISLLIVGLAKKLMTQKRFLVELSALLLIHLGFFFLPVLPGFTLYFIILHSMRVMGDEYSFLKTRLKGLNIQKFIALSVPYTLLSIGGSVFLILLVQQGYLAISNLLLSFMLISIVTLPHSLVMERFYERLSLSRSLT
jgi:Brp/Blh family beta-carotene 15,15'-monooxygenase